MNLPLHWPDTPGALYDQLHEWFGIGAYDDVANAEPPWWQQRRKEVFKLNAQLKSRRTTVRQLALAAWYAHETGARIRWVSDLFKLIPEATRAYNDEVAKAKQQLLFAARNASIEEAVDAGEPEWAERLYRADARMLPELIEQWRTHRD